MNEDFENDVHDYLVQQMDAARRRAFEQRLERDPAAARLVRETANALAGLACDAVRVQQLDTAPDHAALFAIVAAAQGAAPAPRRRWFAGRRLFWPAAVVVLLGINLLDFRRPVTPWTLPGHEEAEAEPRRGAGSKSESRSDDSSNRRAESGVGARGALEPGAQAQAAQEAAREMERLRASLDDLQRSQDRIRSEYDMLVRRLTDEQNTERNLNRLITMELVDAGTYARGERRGLVNVGRGILTEPGVVVAPDTGPPPAGTASNLPRPYAWAVFDERDQRGFLNLYQLPPVSEEQQLHVWVRPTDSTAYQSVSGLFPQPGGTGRVQYSLPPNSRPAEILVTVEPRQITPVVPTGPVVLRGP